MRHRSRRNMFVYDNTPYETRIPQLVARAKMLKSGCLDYELSGFKSHDLKMDRPNHINFKFGQGREAFLLTEFASRQLSTRLGMPFNYYSYLAESRISELQALLCNSVNTLAQYHKEGMLVRTYKDYIRGIVSPQYFVFDTDEILDVFTGAFNDSHILPTNEIIMHGDFLGLDLFHMRFTNSEPVKGLPDKDLHYGMELTSSDVGRSSIKLSFYVYKQVCSNGLCLNLLGKELLMQRHMHVHKDYVYAALMDSFKAFPKMMSLANERIQAACHASIKGTVLLSTDVPVNEQERKLRNTMQKYLNISEGGMYELARIVASDYEPTVWGYVNAITKYAQQFDVVKRLDLEKRAGSFMSYFAVMHVA